MSKTAHFIAGHPLRIGGALGMHKAKEKGGKDGERVFVFKVDEKEYYVSNKIEDDKNGTQEEDSYRGLFGAGYDFTYHQKKWDKIQKDFLEKRVKVLTDLNIDEEEARSFIGKAACGYYAGQEIAGHSSDTDQMYNEFNKLFGSDENQKNRALDSFQELQDHIDIPGIENLRFVHLCSHVANPVQAGLSPDKEGDLKKHFTGLFYKDIKQGDFVDAVKKTIKTAIEKLKKDGFKAINTTTPGDGVFKNPDWPYLGRGIWNDINIKTEGFEYKIQRCSSGNTAKEIVKEFVAQQEKLALKAAEAARKVEEEERLAAEAAEAAKKAEAERLAAEAAEAAKKAEAERLAAEAPEASEAAKKAEEAPEAPEAAEAAEAASSSIGETQTVENRRASLIAKQEEAYKAVKKDPTKLEEYLNPESYVGWGAKIKRSREGVYEIINVTEEGFAAAIGLKVGQAIIINTEELKKNGDVDLMITLAYNLRRGDLTGVTTIGDCDISNQSNKDKISNLYKKNQRIFNKEPPGYKLDKSESPVDKVSLLISNYVNSKGVQDRKKLEAFLTLLPTPTVIGKDKTEVPQDVISAISLAEMTPEDSKTTYLNSRNVVKLINYFTNDQNMQYSQLASSGGELTVDLNKDNPYDAIKNFKKTISCITNEKQDKRVFILADGISFSAICQQKENDSWVTKFYDVKGDEAKKITQGVDNERKIEFITHDNTCGIGAACMAVDFFNNNGQNINNRHIDVFNNILTKKQQAKRPLSSPESPSASPCHEANQPVYGK